MYYDGPDVQTFMHFKCIFQAYPRCMEVVWINHIFNSVSEKKRKNEKGNYGLVTIKMTIKYENNKLEKFRHLSTKVWNQQQNKSVYIQAWINSKNYSSFDFNKLIFRCLENETVMRKK